MRVALKDPRSGGVNNASLSDNSSASPMVGPDGDVYFGVLENPSRNDVARLDAALLRRPHAGQDARRVRLGQHAVGRARLDGAVVHGTSPYLIFTKYNNYAGVDGGDGVNKIAVLDPNATMVEPHASSNGLLVMREVLTIAGPTPTRTTPRIPERRPRVVHQHRCGRPDDQPSWSTTRTASCTAGT